MNGYASRLGITNRSAQSQSIRKSLPFGFETHGWGNGTGHRWQPPDHVAVVSLGWTADVQAGQIRGRRASADYTEISALFGNETPLRQNAAKVTNQIIRADIGQPLRLVVCAEDPTEKDKGVRQPQSRCSGYDSLTSIS